MPADIIKPPGSEYVPLFGVDPGIRDETVTVEITLSNNTYAQASPSPEGEPGITIEMLRRASNELRRNDAVNRQRLISWVNDAWTGLDRHAPPADMAAIRMRQSRSGGKVVPVMLKDDRDDSMMTLDGLKSCHGLDLIKEANAVLRRRLNL